MKKNVTAVSVFLLTAATLFAGGSQDAAKETDGRMLSFKGYFVKENAEPAGIAFHYALENFQQNQPEISWDVENLAHDAYEQKIKTLIAAGDAPDIFQVKADWLDTFIETDVLGSLDYLKDDSDWFSTFNAGAIEEFSRNGNLYIVPYWIVTATNLFYNSRIFEASGIPFPATLDEFFASIPVLTENGYLPFAVGNLGGWFLDVCVFRGFVDRYAGAEWAQGITDKSGSRFTDEVFVDSLRAVKQMGNLDAFNEDMNGIDWLQFKKYYYEGKAAMFMDGSGSLDSFSKECPPEILGNTVITGLPPLNTGGPAGITGSAGWGLVINKNLIGQQRDDAASFIRYFTSEEVANVLAENGGTPAVTTGNYNHDLLSDIARQYNDLMEKTDMSTSFVTDPDTLNMLYEGLQEMLFDMVTPEELAAKMDASYFN